VDDLGLSVGADLVLFLNAELFRSDINTRALVPPAGLRYVGDSFTVELAPPPRYLLGGRPLGALTGDTEFLLELAFLDRLGETTAAAAAIRDRAELPCKSMLFTRSLGGIE